MNALLDVLDFAVLVLIVTLLLRRVWAGLANAPGAPILLICVAVLAALFATISLTVYMGLVDAASWLMRVVLLALAVVLAVVVGVSWTGRPAA